MTESAVIEAAATIGDPERRELAARDVVYAGVTPANHVEGDHDPRCRWGWWGAIGQRGHPDDVPQPMGLAPRRERAEMGEILGTRRTQATPGRLRDGTMHATTQGASDPVHVTGDVPKIFPRPLRVPKVVVQESASGEQWA